MADDVFTVPAGLPVPVDDGAADHPRGAVVPPLALIATSGPSVDLHGVSVAGVSTQTVEYQREFVERNHLPFDLLSDAELRLTRALRLPTFEFPVARGGPTSLIKRMAWYLAGGRIEHVWYPVFPPDRNTETVLAWLAGR